MRKGVPLVLSLAIIAAGLIPAIAAATDGVDCEDVAPEPLAFHAPTSARLRSRQRGSACRSTSAVGG